MRPDYVLREDLTYTLNPKHRLETGVILGLEPGRAIGSRFIRPPDEGEVDYDPRFLERQTFDESVSGKRMEVYLQDRYKVLPFLSVVLGLRVDYFSLLTTFLSNRVGVFCWILWEVLNSNSLMATIIRCRDHHDLLRVLETPT